MRRRTFIALAGLGALALALGRRARAAAGRAFPRPPWRKVDSKKLREPHDLVG
ncbi:MAG: hypothetical protein ABIK09_12740 [Pseudomonadota bacterium]